MARGKPLMVGEYGAQERDPATRRVADRGPGGAQDEVLRDQGRRLLRRQQGLRLAGHESPETLAAFRDMANDPWFTPDPKPLLDAASAKPMLRGIPIPLTPLQFVPRTPPKAPEAPEPPDDPPA